MQRKFMFSLAVLALAGISAGARAQMAVHALSGTVKAVTPRSIDIVVDPSDPTTITHFKLTPNAKVSLEFESALRSDSVAAGDFHHVGAFVVVYFYGYGSDVTAVAFKELSAGPYAKVEGKITDYDRRDHKITLADSAGTAHTFVLSDHLIVDSDQGAGDGRRFAPRKGDDVRVTYASNGTPGTASFIHASM
jgi:hypothetical protein